MAFVGNTQLLCQAIVDGDVDFIDSWCKHDQNDINTRDYVGRTPLHLAVQSSSIQVVQCLIDNGARMIARLVDGRTALHLAAQAGNVEMVKALMLKSLANGDLEDEKKEQIRLAKKIAQGTANKDGDEDLSDSDTESIRAKTDASEDDDFTEVDNESDDDAITQGSFVKVSPKKAEGSNAVPDDDEDEPDVYDIDTLAWDFGASSLHLAIANGHIEMIRLLVEEYGADVLLPIKLTHDNYTPRAAILTLILALSEPQKAKDVARLLLELGASSAQADMAQFTVLDYVVNSKNVDVLDVLFECDEPAARSVLNHVAMGQRNSGNTPLTIAVDTFEDNSQSEAMLTKLLSLGARPQIPADEWIRSFITNNEYAKSWSPNESTQNYERQCRQPLLIAAYKDLPMVMLQLLDAGADPMILDSTAHDLIRNPGSRSYQTGSSLLDIVRGKLKSLRNFKAKDSSIDKPSDLKPESFYVEGLTEGTYKHYTALYRFRMELKKREDARKEEEKKVEEAKEDKDDMELKERIKKLKEEFEIVEKRLVDAGAKTFNELHAEFPPTNNDDSDTENENFGK